MDNEAEEISKAVVRSIMEYHSQQASAAFEADMTGEWPMAVKITSHWYKAQAAHEIIARLAATLPVAIRAEFQQMTERHISMIKQAAVINTDGVAKKEAQ